MCMLRTHVGSYSATKAFPATTGYVTFEVAAAAETMRVLSRGGTDKVNPKH